MCIACSAAVAAVAFAPVVGYASARVADVFSSPLHRRAVRDYRASRFPKGLSVPSWADSGALSAFAPSFDNEQSSIA